MLLLMLLAVTGCDLVGGQAGQKPAAAVPPPPPVVEVTEVLVQDLPLVREWVGVLDGNVNATIRSQVTGYLISQKYREGDAVKKGQILFEIDPRTFLAEVQQAEAARNRQRALFEAATATLARVKPLAERNALSQRDLDEAIASEQSARAALEQASATLETARLNLGFTRIESPIDGIAGIAKAQIGDLLSPGAASELTTVSAVDPIKAYISISEREYLDFLKDRDYRVNDHPLQLVLVDGSVHPYPGEVTLVNREVDPTTGTLKIGALFPNPEARLRPGQFAKLRATVAMREGALLVPQRAVSEVQGRYFIAVVDAQNTVQMRAVVPGERTGSNRVIREGLKPGERVITEGTQKVRDGMTVSPRQAAPAAASSGGE